MIQGKNMSFTIGATVRKLNYIYLNWDRKYCKQFHGSLDHFTTEAWARRTNPAMPGGVVVFRVKAREKKDEGPPQGSKLEIVYRPQYTNPEQIEEFLRVFGIQVQRAKLFEEEIFTVWQQIKKFLNSNQDWEGWQ